ncbi:J domain-containing protein [Dissulfurirhabdus thermomarina]|uniref:J domain-containing protein n=1 Tax=Dissulfurirhabdus thermomarina TaxID=1765737 RepID=A0A6N9TKR3_DISTH|nr:DnaJ C-terminal domain-containing protein [Dissulfurirhabdus thermomarina]NDY41835.1 J domain-containing protein [Dissulfurirhabdus thermomarina]NMX22478.1 J domain-containing protein [Dissulfurirhabdus thermomarina]
MDPWELLGVPRSATLDEIKRAYRERARRCHPDAAGGGPARAEEFRRLRAAYEALVRRAWRGGAVEPAAPPAGDGTFLFLEVSAREALAGTRRDVEVADREVFCPVCDGAGRRPGRGERACPACGGTGSDLLPWGEGHLRVLCTTCGGTGFVGRPVCDRCGGRGRVLRRRRVAVRLPPGVRDGTVLHLPGQGPAHGEGAERSPLYVEVRVRFPPGWRLEGNDVHAPVAVDVWTALLGGQVAVPTLEGHVLVQVPAGSGDGCRLQAPGKGWRDAAGRRGDHVARVRLRLPRRPGPLAEALVRWLRAVWPVAGMEGRRALPPAGDERD